jgi:hypothetical protein
LDTATPSVASPIGRLHTTGADDAALTYPLGIRTINQGASMTEAVHVVPVNDLREHTASAECWCKPSEEDEWPGVWVHHSMDGREAFENGRQAS